MRRESAHAQTSRGPLWASLAGADIYNRGTSRRIGDPGIRHARVIGDPWVTCNVEGDRLLSVPVRVEVGRIRRDLPVIACIDAR